MISNAKTALTSLIPTITEIFAFHMKKLVDHLSEEDEKCLPHLLASRVILLSLLVTWFDSVSHLLNATMKENPQRVKEMILELIILESRQIFETYVDKSMKDIEMNKVKTDIFSEVENILNQAKKDIEEDVKKKE